MSPLYRLFVLAMGLVFAAFGLLCLWTVPAVLYSMIKTLGLLCFGVVFLGSGVYMLKAAITGKDDA